MLRGSPSTRSIIDVFKLIVYTFVLWSFSITILYPLVILLRKSAAVRSKYFAWIWCRFGKANNRLQFLREILFEALKTEIRDFRQKPLDVLEIGVGLSNNLRFYSKNHRVTVIASNADLVKSLQKASKKANIANSTDMTIGIADLSAMDGFPDNSFDLVISNLCLCTVPDVKDVLEEVKRVLRKGGKFAFIEHVGFPEDRLEFALQVIATTYWKVYGDGCCLDRHLLQYLKKARFATIGYTTYYPKTQFVLMRPTAVGVCTK